MEEPRVNKGTMREFDWSLIVLWARGGVIYNEFGLYCLLKSDGLLIYGGRLRFLINKRLSII